MAIANAKRRKIGEQLIDWIYLGIRSGARESVRQYHALKASDLVRAEDHLIRAVNMPVRARARIEEARRIYESENGANTFNTFIGSCLTFAGSVTLAELNSELTVLEADTSSFKAAKASGSTLDQIAALVEAAWRDEIKDWQFPFPAGYTDSWA